MATRRICEFLDGNKVKYFTITHSPAHTAQEVAAAIHVPGRMLAKSVIVNADGKLAMAVVPANRDVDVALLRHAASAAYVHIADASDFADRFEGCQLGAMPPFGNLFGMETYMDTAFTNVDTIAFNAGTHTDAIIMNFEDYRRLAQPMIARISAARCDSATLAGVLSI